MHTRPLLRILPPTFPVLLAVVMTGCVTSYPPYAADDIRVDYYTPRFYDGYPVYYDRVGLPYYHRDKRTVYVPRSYRGYNDLTIHYRRHRPQYHRWYDERGHRYRHVDKHPPPRKVRRAAPPRDPDIRYRRQPQHPPSTGAVPGPTGRYRQPKPPSKPDIRYSPNPQRPPMTGAPRRPDPRYQLRRPPSARSRVISGGMRPPPRVSNRPDSHRAKNRTRSRDARDTGKF
jgi:hypothetical protein